MQTQRLTCSVCDAIDYVEKTFDSMFIVKYIGPSLLFGTSLTLRRRG